MELKLTMNSDEIIMAAWRDASPVDRGMLLAELAMMVTAEDIQNAIRTKKDYRGRVRQMGGMIISACDNLKKENNGRI